MKKLMIPVFIALAAAAFAFTSSAAAAEGKAMTPQQEKFANCAHESKGMKGEEHKKFMSDCLKGKTTDMKAGETAAASSMQNEEHKATSKAHAAREKTGSATTAQKEKMKACNADAKSKKLKGADRKQFMSECLKGG
jgi:hypothetical protein